MSQTSDAVAHGDVDETMLFDDGFSIVDDINAGTGAMDTGGQKDSSKENGKDRNGQSSDVEDTNSKEVVSDKEVKKTEVIDATEKKEEKNEIVEVKKENHCSSKKLDDAKCGDKTILKKELSVEHKTSETKNSTGNDSTLIISNDEDLGPDVPTSDESVVKTEKIIMNDETKNEGSNEVDPKIKNVTIGNSANKPTPRRKTSETSFVWVSNISKLVKASGLKKHFSECGKVNTAKVVTNGKVFFGYVEFESAEHASSCVNMLNNSVLGGKKIIVSRTRPDVTKKSTPSKKIFKNDPLTLKCNQSKKEHVCIKEVTGKPVGVESKKLDDNKKKIDENSKVEEERESGERNSKEDDKKITDKNKSETEEKKVENEKLKCDDKKLRRVKDDLLTSKCDDDLKQKLNDCKKKMDDLRSDLTISQIEVSNLRRRLKNEQSKSRAEEMRSEKYRIEVRSLSDQLKQSRSDFDKEMHRVVKKHKLDLEKSEYHHRENFLKQKEELKRRQEELDREFRKLEDAKKTLEHIKRSRKSRSLSPPIKRFRGRDGGFQDHRSPPPPPKLSSEVRPKASLERPPTYYEEKKPRAIYDRLGDYGEKPFPKEVNGRQRGSYPGDVIGMQKSSWGPTAAESWKKPNNSATFLKPYMERFGSSHPGYQVPSTSYYSPATTDYIKHNHFDISRKY